MRLNITSSLLSALSMPRLLLSTIDYSSRKTTYFPDGINGKRAVARRQRQIAAVQLKVSKS